MDFRTAAIKTVELLQIDTEFENIMKDMMGTMKHLTLELLPHGFAGGEDEAMRELNDTFEGAISYLKTMKLTEIPDMVDMSELDDMELHPDQYEFEEEAKALQDVKSDEDFKEWCRKWFCTEEGKARIRQRAYDLSSDWTFRSNQMQASSGVA